MAFIWAMSEIREHGYVSKDTYFGALSDIFDYMRDNAQGYDVDIAEANRVEYKNVFGDKIIFDKKYMYKKEWMQA